MSESEYDNYFRILVSVQEFGTIIHRKFIKHQLKRHRLTFCELLDTQSHELYHLCYLKSCCQCGPIDQPQNIVRIREDQYHTLFQKDNTSRLNGHPRSNYDSKCCNYAKISVTLDDLDLSLAHTLLMHCCRELLWHCCLTAKHQTLQEFLNRNKHDIIHMWMTNKPCRLCRNGMKPKAKGGIKEADWNLLFVNTTFDEDPSLYSAKQGINVSDLNPRLSYALLQAFSDEINVSRELRIIRNYTAHRPSLKIQSDEFKQKWSEIEKILLQLSKVYGGSRDIKEKLDALYTETTNKDKLNILYEEMRRDVEIEATLNIGDTVVQYMKEQQSSKEDDNILRKRVDALEKNLMERLNRLQNICESRSSNEIKSREIRIKVEVNGTKVSLNKSSVEFIPDNETQCEDSLNKYVVQKTLNRIVGKQIGSTKETDILLKKTNLEFGLDDRTALDDENELNTDKDPTDPLADNEPTTDEEISQIKRGYMKWIYSTIMNCLLWMYLNVKHVKSKYLTMKRNQSLYPVEKNTINVKVYAAEDVSETDPADEFKCGPCKEIFRTIEAFSEHKRLHKERRRNCIRTNVTLEGLSEEQVEDIIKFSRLNGMTIGDVTVLGKAKGSLIIWTRMSLAAFKTKDAFMTAIEQLMEHIFWESPTEINRTTSLTLNVKIEDEFEDDYVDDEEDSFCCGVCLEEFYVLEAFKIHKKSPCRKDDTGSPPELTISDEYLVVEYNVNAFAGLEYLQKRLTLVLEDASLQNELFEDIMQYPLAILYKGDGYSDVDSISCIYSRSIKYQKTIEADELIDIRNKYGVMVCFLEADNGHLTNMDRKCLHKIREDLPINWIAKTLFVINAASFSGSIRHVHTLSNDIGKEIGIKLRDINYRIFKDKDIEDIFQRMSLVFEYQQTKKRDVVCRHIRSLQLKVQDAINHTQSQSFKTTLTAVLLAGPLGYPLHDILRRAAKSYLWNGESFTRNKLTVIKARNQIVGHAIETLGKEIVQTILMHLRTQFSSGNHDFFSAISQHINLKDFEKSIVSHIVFVLFSLLFGPLGWLISAVFILISGTNINSDSFRNGIADKLCQQIHTKMSKIVSDVVDQFCTDSTQRYKQFDITILRSDREIWTFFSDQEDLIKKTNILTEFEILAKKNGLIRDFTFDDNILRIHATGDVRDFVKTYFRSDVRTEIIVHHKPSSKEMQRNVNLTDY